MKSFRECISTMCGLIASPARTRESQLLYYRVARAMSSSTNKDGNVQARRRPMMPITTACTACSARGTDDSSFDDMKTGRGDKIVKDWKCAITSKDSDTACDAFPLEVPKPSLRHSLRTGRVTKAFILSAHLAYEHACLCALKDSLGQRSTK